MDGSRSPRGTHPRTQRVDVRSGRPVHSHRPKSPSCLTWRCTRQQPEHRPRRKWRYTVIPPSSVRRPVGERCESCEATTTSKNRYARRHGVIGSPAEELADRSRVGQGWSLSSSDGNPFTVQLSAAPTADTCSLCPPAVSLTVRADAVTVGMSKHGWYV